MRRSELVAVEFGDAVRAPSTGVLKIELTDFVPSGSFSLRSLPVRLGRPLGLSLGCRTAILRAESVELVLHFRRDIDVRFQLVARLAGRGRGLAPGQKPPVADRTKRHKP